jgi:hypothetical protein
MSEVNPYAPPVSLAPPSLPPSVLFRREGNHVVIRDGAHLPARCVRTNQPVEPNGWTRRKRMTWMPSWVWLLLLVHLIVLIIVGLCVQKKAWLTYSMTKGVRKGYIWRVGVSLIALIGGMALGMAGLVNMRASWGWPAVAVGGVMFLGGAIVAACFHSPLRVTRHRDGEFWIKGCSPEFLDSLDEA